MAQLPPISMDDCKQLWDFIAPWLSINRTERVTAYHTTLHQL